MFCSGIPIVFEESYGRKSNDVMFTGTVPGPAMMPMIGSDAVPAFGFETSLANMSLFCLLFCRKDGPYFQNVFLIINLSFLTYSVCIVRKCCSPIKLKLLKVSSFMTRVLCRMFPSNSIAPAALTDAYRFSFFPRSSFMHPTNVKIFIPFVCASLSAIVVPHW